MTELEILAELKIAYENLEDILENNGEQITKGETKEINFSMEILSNIYHRLYTRIKRDNKEILYYKEELLIGNEIYLDYIEENETEEEYCITYKDLDNEEKWWEDYDYLTK